MKKLKLSIILILFVTISSCYKDFSTDTSPLGDYNLFFEYLENDYAFREFHPFTMDELKQKHLAQIEASNTNETLAEVLLNICNNELKDPHVYMKQLPEPYSTIHVPIDLPLDLDFTTPLFGEIAVMEHTYYYSYGTTLESPEIGYIYIRDFNSDLGGTSSLGVDEGVKNIDIIIKKLIDSGVKSMILDMRSEAGGTSYIPRYIAQRFIDKTAIYMNEFYPEGDHFIKKEWTLKPEGTGFRTQKIAVLSNGQTGSGGEMFVLGMLQRENVIHIGSASIGAAGNIVEKDLSNGWNFIIANSRTEYPDGKQYYKVGITPSIIIKNDKDYGIDNFNDKVIEKAIKELQ